MPPRHPGNNTAFCHFFQVIPACFVIRLPKRGSESVSHSPFESRTYAIMTLRQEVYPFSRRKLIFHSIADIE